MINVEILSALTLATLWLVFTISIALSWLSRRGYIPPAIGRWLDGLGTRIVTSKLAKLAILLVATASILFSPRGIQNPDISILFGVSNTFIAITIVFESLRKRIAAELTRIENSRVGRYVASVALFACIFLFGHYHGNSSHRNSIPWYLFELSVALLTTALVLKMVGHRSHEEKTESKATPSATTSC